MSKSHHSMTLRPRKNKSTSSTRLPAARALKPKMLVNIPKRVMKREKEAGIMHPLEGVVGMCMKSIFPCKMSKYPFSCILICQHIDKDPYVAEIPFENLPTAIIGYEDPAFPSEHYYTTDGETVHTWCMLAKWQGLSTNGYDATDEPVWHLLNSNTGNVDIHLWRAILANYQKFDQINPLMGGSFYDHILANSREIDHALEVGKYCAVWRKRYGVLSKVFVKIQSVQDPSKCIVPLHATAHFAPAVDIAESVELPGMDPTAPVHVVTINAADLLDTQRGIEYYQTKFVAKAAQASYYYTKENKKFLKKLRSLLRNDASKSVKLRWDMCWLGITQEWHDRFKQHGIVFHKSKGKSARGNIKMIYLLTDQLEDMFGADVVTKYYGSENQIKVRLTAMEFKFDRNRSCIHFQGYQIREIRGQIRDRHVLPFKWRESLTNNLEWKEGDEYVSARREGTMFGSTYAHFAEFDPHVVEDRDEDVIKLYCSIPVSDDESDDESDDNIEAVYCDSGEDGDDAGDNADGDDIRAVHSESDDFEADDETEYDARESDGDENDARESEEGESDRDSDEDYRARTNGKQYSSIIKTHKSKSMTNQKTKKNKTQLDNKLVVKKKLKFVDEESKMDIDSTDNSNNAPVSKPVIMDFPYPAAASDWIFDKSRPDAYEIRVNCM